MKQKLRLMGLLCPKSSYYNIQLPILLLAICTLNMCLEARAQRPESSGPVLSGIVADTTGSAISGATITVRGTNARTITGRDGHFTLRATQQNGTLVITYLGHETIHEKFGGGNIGPYHFTLTSAENLLQEVEINSGYQLISAERNTGSYQLIDNEQFNHNTSRDVITRLEAITNATKFTNHFGAQYNHISRPTFTIRGVSGLWDSGSVLIIVDNFPYEGDIYSLNPNDVQDVVILKDAAATSVWGARAANGVIVITTKKGRYNEKQRVDINTNLSFGQKPDLFAINELKPQDYVEVERMLFERGFYNGKLNNRRTFPYVSPAVELLQQHRNGEIGDSELEQGLAELGKYDTRKDFLNYIYRNPINQQYAVNFRGGSEKSAYAMSAGYDKNLYNSKAASFRRTTVRGRLKFKPFEWFELSSGVNYAYSRAKDVGSDIDILYGVKTSRIPYLRLVDDEGKYVYTSRFRQSFLDTAGQGQMLDWRLNPIEEIGRSYANHDNNSLMMDIGMTFNIGPYLTAQALYQHQQEAIVNDRYYTQESYIVRDWINTFSRYENGGIAHGFPLGDAYLPAGTKRTIQNARLQLKGGYGWGFNSVDGLIVAEIRDRYSITREDRFFGYDPESLSSAMIDAVNRIPLFLGGADLLPYAKSAESQTDRFTSILASLVYDYDGRFNATFSARKDASNLYGVKTNQRGAPFWALGIRWNAQEERWFRSNSWDQLSIKMSYGFNGNTSNSVTAMPVITRQNANSVTGFPYATTTSAPNPSLRWERVGTVNVGVEFSRNNGRLSGSLEYYEKRATDVLAAAPLDLSSGFRTQKINSAGMKVTGVDILLNGQIIKGRDFTWATDWMASYNRQVVTRFEMPTSYTSSYIGLNYSLNPLVGKDAFALLVLPFAGLDPESGDPLGYLDGEISKDYSALLNQPVADFQYVGSTSPLYFGSVRNTFRYRDFSLSVNLQYKGGHYFLRESIDYSLLFNNLNGHTDYYLRWQKPGDEQSTVVPSLQYPVSGNRSSFYTRSSVLVEKGDYLKLQELTLSYTLTKRIVGVEQIKFYGVCNNLGFLWIANSMKRDPDASGANPPATKSFAFGMTFNL